MKLTLIRTDKKNVPHLSLRDITNFMERITRDTKGEDVKRLRDSIRYGISEYASFDDIHLIPRVYPSAEFRLDEAGVPVMKQFNGLLVLSVGMLYDSEERVRVKRYAAMLPSTVAAFEGSSRRTVKILVAVTPQDSRQPATNDEADRFCRQAYPFVIAIYDALLHTAGLPTTSMTAAGTLRRKNETAGEGRLLMTGFRMTLDRQPYYNPKAAPLLVPEGMENSAATTLPAEAADSADGKETGQETRLLIDYLQQHYKFRYNEVMGYTECLTLQRWQMGWQPVDERMQNSMAMEARLAGLNIWDKDVNRFVKSNMVKRYNPVTEYLWNVQGSWDGKDHIGMLARTVPTDNPYWEQWFRTWLLAMVAQWRWPGQRYGNSLVPLLISRQGYNKSTFCKSLLPKELQWGYNDNLNLDDKKQVLQGMSQFLLINLDEFNQIRPRVQDGFLKNLVQLASVKVKRPYGRHVEDFPRLASFIATANVSDILSDPSGSRRFIGVELKGPINVNHHINHRQLYAQAMQLLSDGATYWMDERQTRLVMQWNQRFKMRSPEEMLFHECFDIPTDERSGQYMSASAIFMRIKQQAGAGVKISSMQAFGRMLSNMEGLQRRRSRFGTDYLVSPLKP